MSAATLAPSEQAVVDAFGIHDPDVIARLEEHWDDVIPCRFACDQAATCKAVMQCCGFSWLACDAHMVQGKREATEYLLVLMIGGRVPVCTKCEHKFEVGATFDEVYRVVSL